MDVKNLKDVTSSIIGIINNKYYEISYNARN